MVRATMHGGPRDGEVVEMPWARIEIPFLRIDDVTAERLPIDLYLLRGPWRGQEQAHYDYAEPSQPVRSRWQWHHRLIRWLWIRWGVQQPQTNTGNPRNRSDKR